jgi:hypothetical protein
MSGPFSKALWKRPLPYAILACASVLVFLACATLDGVYGDASTIGAVAFILAMLSIDGFLVGVIGTVVTLVTSRRRRHSPPARPMV